MPGWFDWYKTWSATNAQKYPAIDQAWQQMQMEMPKEAAGVAKLTPMNWLERRMKPGAQAIAWPWGRIAFNPQTMGNMRPDDLLAHELIHIRQRQRQGLLGNIMSLVTAPSDYQARSYEKEAFAYEKARANRRDSDIPLPPNGQRKVQKAAHPPRRAKK